MSFTTKSTYIDLSLLALQDDRLAYLLDAFSELIAEIPYSTDPQRGVAAVINISTHMWINDGKPASTPCPESPASAE